MYVLHTNSILSLDLLLFGLYPISSSNRFGLEHMKQCRVLELSSILIYLSGQQGVLRFEHEPATKGCLHAYVLMT